MARAHEQGCWQSQKDHSDPDKACTCQNIECPFCGEDDFDLIGLRAHIWRCGVFNETPDP